MSWDANLQTVNRQRGASGIEARLKSIQGDLSLELIG
jgi:hypothetical protein